MSRLVESLRAHTAQAELDLRKLRVESAIPRACFMTEPECHKQVQGALAAARQGNPAPWNDPLVRAAMGALPKSLRDQAMADLRSIIAGRRAMERAIPLRPLERDIKDAQAQISSTRAIAKQKQDDTNVVVINPDAPRECARAFVENRSAPTPTGETLSSFVHWRGDWYVWRSPRYVLISQEEFRGEVYSFLETAMAPSRNGLRPVDPDRKMVEDLIHALVSLIFIDSATTMIWLGTNASDRPDPADLVIFANGMLSISRWLEGKPEAFMSPTPELFCIAALPFAFDPTATCPQFEAFLADVFLGDPHLTNALRVWGGYLLSRDTSLQVIAVLVGASRSGKGTLIRILTALLGSDHVATPKLSSLKGDFGLSGLQGKTFAAITDCHHVGKDSVEAVEILLAISGEDAVDVNRKYHDIVHGIRLQVRFAMLMNELVNLPDITGALLNRIEFFPFRKSFAGKEDTGLSNRIISTEMPGVANWFLEGLRILRHTQAHARANGDSDGAKVRALLRAPIGEDYRRQFRCLTSPIFGFVDERCEIGPLFEVDKQSLYQQYIEWREANGHNDCSSSKFHSDLHSVVSNLTEVRPRGDQGVRQRMFKGIRLKGLWIATLAAETASGGAST